MSSVRTLETSSDRPLPWFPLVWYLRDAAGNLAQRVVRELTALAIWSRR